MKKTLPLRKLLLPFILVACISLTACKKDKNPLEELPPETQYGANTFGCLVNGSAFIPQNNGSLSPVLSSYYQYIYPTASGYVFNVSATDRRSCCFGSVFINIDSAVLEEGKKYLLSKFVRGTASGGFNNGIDDNALYKTNNEVVGELLIKKIDKINQVVAGTFWYNAVNSLGDTVKITNGRFDVKYTR